MIDIFLGLFAYLIFVLLIALFINGIKISSSGETVILPDGTEKDSEMILYPIAKYLNQKVIVPVYLTSRSEADNLMKKINSAGFGTLMVAISSQTSPTKVEAIMVTDGMFAKLKEVLFFIDQSYVIEQTETANSIAIYKDEEVYRFSKYIRKPIIQCIICMASFWGTIAYWIPVSIVLGFTFHTVLLWPFTIVILSYANFLIYKHK